MNNNDTTKQNTNSADKKASQSIIISNLINEAKRLKSEGNSYFTTQNYEAAEVAYSHGLKVIQSLSSYINRKHHPNNSDNGSSTINDNDVVFNLDIISLQVAFWSNQAFVLNNIGKYEEAERICTMALDEIVKERKVYTSLMKELQEKDGIEISSSSSSASIVVVCAKVLDVLATGQVKIKYRRAKANESMDELHKAVQDLQENLKYLRHNTKKKNSRNKDISDTIIALGKVHEKLDQLEGEKKDKKRQQEQPQQQQQQQDNDDDVSMEECNDDSDMVEDSHIGTSQKTDQSTLAKKSHEEMNNHIDKNVTSITLQQQQQQQQKSSTTVVKKNGAQKEGTDKKSITVEKLYPTPDKQKEIIMKLLCQSPRQGEAFFLINYDWWKIWTQHVNFFMNSQYSKLLSEFVNTKEDESTGQKVDGPKLEAEIRQLLQERKGILSLLPMGAVMPRFVIENEKSKVKQTSSDDILSDLSSDEENSDDDEDDDEGRNIYGPEPSVINNSNLIFQYPHRGRNLGQYDASSVFYFQWNHRVKEEGIYLGNKYVLRPRLVRGHHFELLPREVYAALRCWYGESTPSICRRATLFEGSVNVTLYPELQWNDSLSTMNVGSDHDSSRKVTFCGACGAKNARLRCSNCTSIYYCDASCQASHWSYHKARCKILARLKFQPNYDPHQSRDLTTDPMKDPKWGRVGLCNLGNTCFMNSALQCLSHSAPLTRHFLTNRFKNDLNYSNPLGAGGKLANAYNTMIKEIWLSNDKSAISPIALKRAIAMFAPRFSGMNQHDSQEFLAFLLDGLHEDLNRVKNPPYIEKADVSNDHKLSIAGEEAWDAHCLRNRSVVMDTFYGAFKSTCVCPSCDNVSVSFDAFNHISLEIPQRKVDTTRTIPVVLFSISSSSSGPIRYAISVPINCTLGDVKVQLSKLSNLPTSRLFLCEIFESKIYEIYQDDKDLTSIDKDDVVVAYEIDPYHVSTIHVVSTHWIVRPFEQNRGKAAPMQNQRFGYPLMSSFGTDFTCKEIWEHFRKRFAYLLPNSSYEESSTCFQIRLVDCNGKPRPIFDKGLTEEKTVDECSSLLPQSDRKFSSFVGGECYESFLFFTIEWDPYSQNSTSYVFDDRIFNNFSNHVSVIEAIKKQRSSNKSTVSLEDCLKQFIQPEGLDEDNKWYCGACKSHVCAEKTMEMWRLPNVLIIHLKRFEFKNSLRREKLESLVDFPIEGLDMTGYCAQSSNDGSIDMEKQFCINGVPAWYDLFGVVNHYGRMGFGHYTSCARRWTMDSIDNGWAVFDDSSVRGISKEQVVSSAAYVLFYRRRVFV